jgi:hypothetical protein
VPGLALGRRYFFRIGSIRSWNDQQQRSALSGEVSLAPRPEGRPAPVSGTP